MVLVCLLFIVGLWSACSGISGLFAVAQVKFWPTTQGLLRAKDLWVTGRGNTWIPLMKYDYAVNGGIYTGEKISYDKISAGSKEELVEALSSYVPGMPVTVHYKPGNPATAVLQIGSVSKSAITAILGLAALGAAVFFARFYRRKFGSLDYNPFEN